MNKGFANLKSLFLLVRKNANLFTFVGFPSPILLRVCLANFTAAPPCCVTTVIQLKRECTWALECSFQALVYRLIAGSSATFGNYHSYHGCNSRSQLEGCDKYATQTLSQCFCSLGRSATNGFVIRIVRHTLHLSIEKTQERSAALRAKSQGTAHN